MKTSNDFCRPPRVTRLVQDLGLGNDRNLFWSFYEPRNFGDWIGPYLFEHMTGLVPVHARTRVSRFSRTLFSVGSILRHLDRPGRADVWGSGIISADDQFERPRAVHAVRGPFTRDHLHRLGYPTSDVFGDPAILLPLCFSPGTALRHRVGIVPHFQDLAAIQNVYSGHPDILVIDPTRDVETVVSDILSCGSLLSSSLHGLVVAHTYGLPCAWVDAWSCLQGDGVKYRDYFAASGITGLNPIRLEADLTAAQLETISHSAPLPDLAALRLPLLAAFPRPMAGSRQIQGLPELARA